MRRRGRLLVIVLCLAVIGILCDVLSIGVRNAQAIPAFARKYDFACNVCHVPSFPKLNDFGNLFRDHGYQLGTEQELPTWEGLTKGYWPVSFRTTVGYQLQSKVGQKNTTSLVGDTTTTTGSFGFTGLDVLSFGILHRDITFGLVFTPGLASAGFNAASTATTGNLESAFIKLDNLQRFVGLSDKSYLMNFKVGKYELDLPFSEKRSPTLNTQFLAYHYIAGTPFITGGLTSPLTNPNDFALGANHSGAELSGIQESLGGYTRYSLNAISNSDINTTASGGGRALQFYGHLTQSLGGYGVVSGQRIGVYGMAGEVPTAASAAGVIAGAGGANQSFSRVGADASLTAGGQVNVFGTWMVAKDDRKLFTTTNAREARWNGGFVEADYNPVQLPKWLFIYRYDWITNTQQPDKTLVVGGFDNLQGHTAAIRYNFHLSQRTDIALHLEWNHLAANKTAASGGNQVQDTMLTGFDFAF
ncbi:MAG: hypothetical protein HY284_03065 [Nitrospirae bacterium]|nr:hypothetical protein [Nitrospirota bacterium]